MSERTQRSEGVVVSAPSQPKGALWEQAQAVLKAKAAASKERAIARAERPVPNRIAYATTAFKDWKPGMKLPHCKRCHARLDPEENHVCPVKLGIEDFKPKYIEHTQEREERREAKRAEIRESRESQRRRIVCSVCGEDMPELEDAEAHYYSCGEESRAVWEGGYAVDGEPDGDLDGYEDEPEEDYCEGDDDGYDCD